KQLAAQADEAAAGNPKFDAYSPVSVIMHIYNFALALAQLLHDHANEFFRNIDSKPFDRLHQLAVDSLGDDLRLADHQFIAFTAHHFNKDRKLQFAAPHNLERIGAVGVLHPQGNIGQKLLIQALAQVARGNVAAIFAGKWRCVHREQHGDSRFVDDDVRQRNWIFGACDCLANSDAFDAGNRDNVAQHGFRDVGALEAREGEQFRDFGGLKGAIQLGDAYFFSGPQGSVEHPSNRQTSQVVAVIEIGDQDLQWPNGIALWSGDCLQDSLEQRLQVFAPAFGVDGRGSRL